LKRKILFLCCFIFFIQYSYSENTIIDLSLKFLIPETNESQVSGFINAGYGKYFPIVPNIISPGIYAEAGIGADWLYLFSLFSDNYEPSRDENHEFGFNLGANLGFRLFNLIEIGIFDINLFTGYSLSILLLKVGKGDYEIIHNPMVGASVAWRLRTASESPMGLGLEYAYHIPIKFSNRIPIHQVAIIFRFKENYNDYYY
jgi:hypothetical protein